MEPATQYRIILEFNILNNELHNSIWKDIYTATEPITNLTAQVTEDNKILFSWTNPETFYKTVRIYYYLENQDKWYTVVSNKFVSNDLLKNGDTSYIYPPNANAGTDKIFRFNTCRDLNDVESKDTLIYISLPPIFLTTSLPSSQTNSSNPTSQIDLKWYNSTNGYSGIDIYYKLHTESDDKWVKKIGLGPSTEVTSFPYTYTITDLSPNTEYDFKLVPYRTNAVTGVNWYNNGYVLTCSTTAE